MPEIELFLEGYHLKEGQNFENYTIDKINMSHNSIVRYVDYAYPYEISMSWRGSGLPNQELVQSLEYYLTNYLSNDRIVRSYSGRPYKCNFFYKGPTWKVSEDMKSIVLEGEGFAHRIKESEVGDINKANAW